MEHKSKLEALHQESLQHVEDYFKTRVIENENKEKIEAAKSDWQVAWSKLMETMLVLEKLEI